MTTRTEAMEACNSALHHALTGDDRRIFLKNSRFPVDKVIDETLKRGRPKADDYNGRTMPSVEKCYANMRNAFSIEWAKLNETTR